MRLAVALCALFMNFPALAQTGRIQVEVLVFAYNNPESGSALAPGDAEPNFTGMLLGEGGALYSALPPEALKLGGAYGALARHARTRALVHIGWQQDAGSTRPVRLRGRESIRSSDPERGALATELPELDGDLSLRFGRGVEAHVDALLRVATRDSAGRVAGEQRFRLNSKRIMNYGELHYLDHPALGVIVRVDPVEAVSSE
jgi:HAMP domain-containing protein